MTWNERDDKNFTCLTLKWVIHFQYFIWSRLLTGPKYFSKEIRTFGFVAFKLETRKIWSHSVFVGPLLEIIERCKTNLKQMKHKRPIKSPHHTWETNDYTHDLGNSHYTSTSRLCSQVTTIGNAQLTLTSHQQNAEWFLPVGYFNN